MVLAAGLGPFAGTLALALHTTGVLGRLFAEALENTPAARRRRRLAGGGAPALDHLLVRHAAAGGTPVAGLRPVSLGDEHPHGGDPGLSSAPEGSGAQLYYSLSLFHEAEASTVILAMLMMAVVVDGVSAWLRRASA
jgi:phosphonate transport system permease protein